MKWTTERPSVPGWYWFEEGVGSHLMVRVSKTLTGELLAVFPNMERIGVQSVHPDFRWAGPVPIPGE